MTLANILINRLKTFKENIIKAVPTPNNETPLSDVNNGNKGKSPNYARSDHQHPLSSAYATANHNHGQIDKDGKLSTTTSTVGNVVVTDGSNIVKIINKLPSANVTHQDISGKLDIAQGSSDAVKNKNVVTNSSGNIILENKPTIPDVSGKIDTAGTGLTKNGTTLSADIGGSSSISSSKLVACNDSRLSDSRTPTSHNHTISNLTNVSTVSVTVTYTDNTPAETITLLKYTGS